MSTNLDPSADRIRAAAAKMGWRARSRRLLSTAYPTGALPKKENALSSLFLGAAFKKRPVADGPVPSRFDWRERGLVTASQDQEPLTACVSYAICAVAEARLSIAGERPPLPAPRFLHLCTLRLNPTAGIGAATAARDVLKSGIPFSSEAAYQSATSATVCELPKPQIRQVQGFFEFADARELKREIAAHGPAIVHMELRKDFWELYDGGVYKSTELPIDGKHAVCIVGYDDAEHCWIGKNSRGPAWGEKGFFRIAYGESGILGLNMPAYSLDMHSPA